MTLEQLGKANKLAQDIEALKERIRILDGHVLEGGKIYFQLVGKRADEMHLSKDETQLFLDLLKHHLKEDLTLYQKAFENL